MDKSDYDRCAEMRGKYSRFAAGTSAAHEVPGTEQCSLCHRYLPANPMRGPCDGCPVQVITGKSLCRNTPLLKAISIYAKKGKASNEFKAACIDVVTFIESVQDVIAALPDE